MNPIAPCPFCQYTRCELVAVNIGGRDFAHVLCSECLAQGPLEATAEKAADRWESLRKPEPAVPDKSVKSKAFMCGYERAQGRWEATHEELYEHNCWLRNPFEAGTDEQKGFSQAVYDLTR